jgi:hypothetical protein
MPAPSGRRTTTVSFTLGSVDVTRSLPDVVSWWSCADCGVDVELPAIDAGGFLLICPDCPGALHELWRWEPAAA